MRRLLAFETEVLKGLTEEQLRDELKHREQIAKQEAVPRLRTAAALGPLRKACQEYIGVVATRGEADFDLKQRIFETAMMALFEPGVLGWLEQRE